MAGIVSTILTTLITAPILVYFLVFIVCKQWTKNHQKSINLALDFSTIFFIFSVHFLIITIWEKSFLWVIFIFMSGCAILFVIINWKVKREILFSRFIRGYWRFNFLVFFIAYLTLTIYGLIQSVNNQL